MKRSKPPTRKTGLKSERSLRVSGTVWKPSIRRECVVCGKPFRTANPKRQTCQPICSRLHKPHRKESRRTTVPSERDLARWRTAIQPRCESTLCDAMPRAHDRKQHHVIYAQHVRNLGGDTCDPRNSFTVCELCHSAHHSKMDPLLLTDLPDSAFEFANELLGAGPAYGYLRRRYGGHDPRLEALIA